MACAFNKGKQTLIKLKLDRKKVNEDRMKIKLAIAVLILASNAFCEDYKVTDQVYFELQHGDKYIGRIEIGLFGEIVPKTVHNFKTLATIGINGMSYEGSTFHRIIQRFMIQGGDIIKHDGTHSVSIYGGLFDDENFFIKHNGPGLVSMANSGPNSNGCQFFITTMATPWLDGYHTVFGKVLRGQEVVHLIEHVKTDSDDVPLETVTIIQSGIIETPKAFYVSEEPYDYSFLQWIWDGLIPLSFSFTILAFFHWAIRQIDNATKI